jgi:hypothetical protein
MKGFRKEKNMRLDPKVSLLAYDPKNPLRNLEIRGTVVEMTEEGAVVVPARLPESVRKKRSYPRGWDHGQELGKTDA